MSDLPVVFVDFHKSPGSGMWFINHLRAKGLQENDQVIATDYEIKVKARFIWLNNQAIVVQVGPFEDW